MFPSGGGKSSSGAEPEGSAMMRAQHCPLGGIGEHGCIEGNCYFSEFYFKSQVFGNSWGVTPQVYQSVYPGSSRQETVLAVQRHEAAGHKMVAGEAGCVLLRDRSQSEVVRTNMIQV